MTDELDIPEISFTTLWRPLERHRRLALISAIAGALLFIGIRILMGREYTSTASFFPQTQRNASSMGGIAAQLGLFVPMGNGTQSPQFYSDLVESPTILRAIVLKPYYVGLGTRKTLLDIYHVKGETQERRIEKAMDKLRTHLSEHVSPKTGVVSVSATSPIAILSAQIIKDVIERINNLNLQMRHDQANADRDFTEQRVNELAGDLRAAENRLQAFMQENRDYRNSPRLEMEQERLAREVSMRQQLFSSMADSYNQARMESMRDNPVITVIDTAQVAASPDPRGMLKWMVGGSLIGFLLALLVGVVYDRWIQRTVV